MTNDEFNKAWNNYELDDAFAQFKFDNYPDKVTLEDFAEYMVTE
jgi:hypothetical protein